MLAAAIRLSLAEAAAPSVNGDYMLTAWPPSSQQPLQPAWVSLQAAHPFDVLTRHTHVAHDQAAMTEHLAAAFDGGESLPAPLNHRHSRCRIRTSTCTKLLGRRMKQQRCCPSRQTSTLPGNKTVMHLQLLCRTIFVCAQVSGYHACEIRRCAFVLFAGIV